MQRSCKGIKWFGSAAVALALLAGASASSAGERPLFIAVGDVARAPIGWIEFCSEYKPECDTKQTVARDVVMSPKVWQDLVRVNKWANDSIKPITDLEHWGGRTLELSGRRLRRLRRLRAPQAADADASRLAA